jgi:D-sedoheptulose 7-phosphate isomerase
MVQSQTGAGRKSIFIGNGSSAAIASHQAIDYWKHGGMRAIAFNDSGMLACVGE